jgi:tRNA A-37 threonylcarbamoyl transferase component Bud32
LEDLSGKKFGPYHILGPLGEGGTATVFKAFDPNMERHVAVKVLPRQLTHDPQFLGRFRQEARLLANLQHPHILPVFDFGEAEGYTYLVLPLVQTGTLKDLLRGEPLPLEQIREIGAQVGDALDYAHSRDLVHRDVKPSNVLIDGRGNCMLTDFGIAKVAEVDAKFTATGSIVGTPAYMSPEQGGGDLVDARSDIYALGVVLYEMATGRVPFEAETPVAVIFKHIQEPLPPPRTLNPELPEAVAGVIVKALAKEPGARYATAAALVKALRSAIPVAPAAAAAPGKGSVGGAAPALDARASRAPATPSVGNRAAAFKRVVGRTLPWVLLAGSLIAVGVSLLMTGIFAADYTLLRIPFASGFVFILDGLILALIGLALYWRRRTNRAEALLSELSGQPLEEDIPAVYGHEHLERAEFLSIIQILFRHTLGPKFIQVRPLPGGYGGGTTVLARLQREEGEPTLPRSFVIKLGDGREMADEHEKFRRYVAEDLPQAARFLRYAVWEDVAGIAYEFAGLNPEHEVQSLYQFYQGYATVEVSELIGKAYLHLGRAWYRKRRPGRVDLFGEYYLLNAKQREIIGHIGEIVDQDDPYRANFTVVERGLQPNLKPSFCPDVDLPWSDPVAFLRGWPRHALDVSIYRSVVHGDLHARNVLVEIGRDGSKQVWFIDFSHTGNGLSGARTREALREHLPIHPECGHTLRDFCRLEADVKFILTRLGEDADLRLGVAFEQMLLAGGLDLPDPPVTAPSAAVLRDERFRKAWQIVREIRRQAAAYLVHPDDLRPYYLSLLHATLPMVYYHPAQFADEVSERLQKRYALLSAGMLCSRL